MFYLYNLGIKNENKRNNNYKKLLGYKSKYIVRKVFLCVK